jgi:DNA-binding transcriptional ArsR family regulator
MKYEMFPGKLFDLIKVFHFYFNKDLYKSTPGLGNYDILESKVLSIIDGVEIDEKLNLFFHAINSGSFMAETFIRNHTCDLISPDAFPLMINKIRTMDLFGAFLKYCTKNENHNFEENLSVNYLYELLENINMPDRLKMQALYFNSNKKLFTDLLINTLTTVYKRIELFYDNECDRLHDVHALLKNDKLQCKLSEICSLNPEKRDKYFYSTSLLQERFVLVVNSMGNLIFLFGYNTIQHLFEMIDDSKTIDVNLISKSIADNLGKSILNLLKVKGELNNIEIAKLLGKGSKAVFYQIEKLYNAQLLKTRDSDKYMYYSLNQNFLNEYADYISSFATLPNRKL